MKEGACSEMREQSPHPCLQGTKPARLFEKKPSEMLTKAALLLYPDAQVLWMGSNVIVFLAVVGYRQRMSASGVLLLYPVAQDLWLDSCYIG